MRIDAHLHFWRPASGFDNRPVAEQAAYRRDFLPEHVAPALAASGIGGAILVQTAPQAAETAWLLDLVRQEPLVLGVTGWVDLDAPIVDWHPLATEARLVGIRAQLRRVAADDFVGRPNVVRNLRGALEAGLAVTFLAEQRHHAHVLRVLDELPPGPVTLNHLGLPFPHVDRSAWRLAMRAYAKRPDLFVQLSGLPFLYGTAWRSAAAAAVLDDVLDVFGPARLVFASDWPMLVRFASYGEWVEAVEAFIARRGLSAAEAAGIFAGNARRANPRLAHAALPLPPALDERHAAPV